MSMFYASRDSVPDDALLKSYSGDLHPERWSEYNDCFSLPINRDANLADFVFAFYTSPVFRVERLILRVLLGSRSTDAQARSVAEGSGKTFAVWRVGARTDTQLLMCDRYERTRSWFRVVLLGGGRTLLQFGSAVATEREGKTRKLAMGKSFNLLLGFHVLYSKILLQAAKARMIKLASLPKERVRH